jgi:hypothetical protein
MKLNENEAESENKVADHPATPTTNCGRSDGSGNKA